MRNLFAFIAAPILLMLLLAILGVCAAIFYGIIWMISTYSIMSFCFGVALWLAAAFIVRVLIEVIDR
jgi:hypothetical protein